jgi:hypothetical protein
LNSFNILEKLWVNHRAMHESLAAGLLHSVVRCAIICHTDDWESVALWRILTKPLPASTIYFSALAELEMQLRHVQPGVDAQNSCFYDAWQLFATLA